MYGESAYTAGVRLGQRGLSPRVRGIRRLPAAAAASRRSIPACTGNPLVYGRAPAAPRVYPRVYGESLHATRTSAAVHGLSPRVRGIHLYCVPTDLSNRSIPACTGNPRGFDLVRYVLRVYPRVYGESAALCAPAAVCRGLSPRVRGIPHRPRLHRRRRGSIPACTGNPPAGQARRRRARVYPRVYGESVRRHADEAFTRGLSPRVRGIRHGRRRGGQQIGSIPACTGNPPAGQARRRRARVYPRVYGESHRGPRNWASPGGLSPRVRGIPTAPTARRRTRWSIPACTGNPRYRPGCRPVTRVYPRVYGESAGALAIGEVIRGLSPRVRGIPDKIHSDKQIWRSIPACTGNPTGRANRCRWSRVYPRVYGESNECAAGWAQVYGLSPRVRGILQRQAARGRHLRSIPACTGNPPCRQRTPTPPGVYPRVYGESVRIAGQRLPDVGLSPRVRGIQGGRRDHPLHAGSIPACTGNPAPCCGAPAGTGVYPRVYGESGVQVARDGVSSGLSPRVRGILPVQRRQVRRRGSIPACTGNPCRPPPAAPAAQVYPRVYGESAVGVVSSAEMAGLSPRVRGILAPAPAGTA